MLKTRYKTVFGTTVFSLLFLVAALSPVEVSAGKSSSKIKADVRAWRPRSLSILGITGMECNSTYTVGPGPEERFWLFKSEPKITGIDPGGPVNGVLLLGDVLVAVDGMLITTRKAGLRFANITPGEPVEIAVRRRGRMIDVTIVPAAVFSEDDWESAEPGSSAAESLKQWSKSIESLARLSTELSSIMELQELPGLPEVFEFLIGQELLGIQLIPVKSILPSGWFGFNLSFSGTIVTKKESGWPVRWQFDSPPEIRSVEPDSPADRAGLKPGDVLTHIDGMRLSSKKGGKHFSAVQPGQTVVWTIKRDGVKLNVEMVAVERPESRIPRTGEEPPPGSDLEGENQRLRFTGSLGGTDVEVTGDSSVEIIEDKERGEIIIKTRGATIRLRLSDKE